MMAPQEQDANSASEAVHFSDNAHFREMVKQMYVDESIFTDEPSAETEASSGAQEEMMEQEEVQGGSETAIAAAHEPVSVEGNEGAQEPLPEEEPVLEQQQQEPEETEKSEPLNHLGPGSNVDGFFEAEEEQEEEQEEEDLDFTDEDLDGLPLFDDLDDDPAAVLNALPDRPPPKRPAPPKPDAQIASMEKEPEEERESEIAEEEEGEINTAPYSRHLKSKIIHYYIIKLIISVEISLILSICLIIISASAPCNAM